MQNAFLDWIMPKNGLDAAVKTVCVLCLVLMSNIGFAQLYLGYQPLSAHYHVINTIVVGLPWLLLFLLASARQKRTEAHLRWMSQRDEMTGLLNRATFLDAVQALSQAGRGGTLLMLDADHFKSINDRFGHASGDNCIRNIGRRLKSSLRADDLAGRMGGEEFAVFLPGLSLDRAGDVIDRLLQPVRFRDCSGAANLDVTLSIGAVAMEPAAVAEDHLILADKALYTAKAAGRGCVRYWGDDAVAVHYPETSTTPAQRHALN